MVLCERMRYLILSDVHANAQALEAVIRHADYRGYDGVVFLGDAVGYYPEPEEVVARLRSLEPVFCILGNHDAVLLAMADGKRTGHREDGIVTEVLGRQLRELSSESLEFLRSFEGHVVRDGWEATHGALKNPWDYLTTLSGAQSNLELMSQQVCLVGHTHVPKIFAAVDQPSGQLWRTVQFRQQRALYRVPPKARVFVNPGSVGQPRDGLPLAAYALYDDEANSFEMHRVEFDVAAVQRAVRSSGYPEVLASRLAVGR